MANVHIHGRRAKPKIVASPLLNVCVELQDIQDSLGVLGIVLLGNSGFGQ